MSLSASKQCSPLYEKVGKTRAPQAGAKTRLQLLLENSKSKGP